MLLVLIFYSLASNPIVTIFISLDSLAITIYSLLTTSIP